VGKYYAWRTILSYLQHRALDLANKRLDVLVADKWCKLLAELSLLAP
jgi:hypothetical protein